MTEREKMIENLKRTSDLWKEEESHGYIVSVDLGKIADTLIEAGIGDKSGHRLFISKDGTEIKQLYSDEEVEDIVRQRDEAELRAEVAERALLRLCEETMRDKLIIMYPVVGRQVRDKQELYDYCIKQAEKELAEEEKGE